MTEFLFKKISDWEFKIRVTLDFDDYSATLTSVDDHIQAYHQSNIINVHQRKNITPVHILRKDYAKEYKRLLYFKAVENSLRDRFHEKRLFLLETKDITLTFGKDRPLKMIGVSRCIPHIDLDALRNVTVERFPRVIPKSRVDSEMTRFFKQHATLIPLEPDEKISIGNQVSFKYSLKYKESMVPVKRVQDPYTVTAGYRDSEDNASFDSLVYILADFLIGHTLSEKYVTIPLVMPENHSIRGLRGKEVTAIVRLYNARTVIVNETDELIQALNIEGIHDKNDLRDFFARTIYFKLSPYFDDDFYDRAFRSAIRDLNFVVPDDILQDELLRYIKNYNLYRTSEKATEWNNALAIYKYSVTTQLFKSVLSYQLDPPEGFLLSTEDATQTLRRFYDARDNEGDEYNGRYDNILNSKDPLTLIKNITFKQRMRQFIENNINIVPVSEHDFFDRIHKVGFDSSIVLDPLHKSYVPSFLLDYNLAPGFIYITEKTPTPPTTSDAAPEASNPIISNLVQETDRALKSLTSTSDEDEPLEGDEADDNVMQNYQTQQEPQETGEESQETALESQTDTKTTPDTES